MSYTKKKYYVVWEGRAPGIYDSWEECQDQINGYAGAKFKSFGDLETATEAFRGDPKEYTAIFKALANRRPAIINYEAFPEIRLDAIAVDAACSRNPGPVEYRGVAVGTGSEIFKVGPLEDGTNNIGEYLAIIHAAAMLAKNGDSTTPIYSDSRTALSWIKNRRSKTTITPTERNSRLLEILRRADIWIATHNIPNPLLK
ncbi:MAG: ribonuclease H family protein, partial [Muribaculaceae bacterium]|nr:ribonuclease H family protein [Muribaculaceae bacterium]